MSTLFHDYQFLFIEASKEDPAKTFHTTLPLEYYTLNQSQEEVSFIRSLLAKGGYNLVYSSNLYANPEKPDQPRGGFIVKPVPDIGYRKAPIYLQKSILGVVPNDKRIVISTNLADPRLPPIIRSILQTYPEFQSYTISNLEYDNELDDWTYIDHGLATKLLGQTKIIKKKAPHYIEDTYETFKFEVFKDLKDFDWYHATRQTNWPSIKQKGLLPSNIQTQGQGWTQLNFNLQHAVYLTRNASYATQIAHTLTDRYDEPAIVVKVDGNALKDYTKIAVDEDALRNDFDGAIDASYQSLDLLQNPRYLRRLPLFHTSVTDPKLSSIGYRSIIEPKYLSILHTIQPIGLDDEEQER